jgi:hypothetical protein
MKINSLMRILNKFFKKNSLHLINQMVNKKKKNLLKVKNKRNKSLQKFQKSKIPHQKSHLNQSHQKKKFTLMMVKLNLTMINLKKVTMNQKSFHKQKDLKSNYRVKEVLKTHFQQKADLIMNRFKVLKSRNHFKNLTHLYLKNNYLENLLYK